MPDRLYPQLTEENVVPAKRREVFLAVLLPVLILIVVCSIRHDPYQRFLKMEGDAVKLKWVYERIHFDDTPIDIALIGTSRTMVAVDDQQLETDLLGDNSGGNKVANLAVSWQGRNMHYLLTKELLEKKKCEVVILEVQESLSRQGHKLFSELAHTPDLVTAPLIINNQYFQDISFLPHRNSRLMFENMYNKFSKQQDFDLTTYSGSHFPSLHDVDRTSEYMAEENTRLEKKKKWRVLPAKFDFLEFRYPRHYLNQLVNLASKHETQVVFLYLPYFGYQKAPKDEEYFRQSGELLIPPPEILENVAFWSDATHLNAKGNYALTQWLANQLKQLELVS